MRIKRKGIFSYLLSTPPNRDAFKHSGGDSLRWTSPTVTLYFDVELSNDSRPGTLQNTSEGVVDIPVRNIIKSSSLVVFYESIRKIQNVLTNKRNNNNSSNNNTQCSNLKIKGHYETSKNKNNNVSYSTRPIHQEEIKFLLAKLFIFIFFIKIATLYFVKK